MSNEISIGDIIVRYIKLRGKTVKEVAVSVGKNEKTFYGILERDAVDAKLLFKCSSMLDIDLNWMAEMYSHHENISPTQMCQVQRMSDDFRKAELKSVIPVLDRIIAENPEDLTDVRNELKKCYPQIFYLLDVLAPPKTQIIISVERGKEKYLCIEQTEMSIGENVKHKPIPMVRNENEMLNLIIAKRREEL